MNLNQNQSQVEPNKPKSGGGIMDLLKNVLGGGLVGGQMGALQQLGGGLSGIGGGMGLPQGLLQQLIQRLMSGSNVEKSADQSNPIPGQPQQSII